MTPLRKFNLVAYFATILVSVTDGNTVITHMSTIWNATRRSRYLSHIFH